MSVRTGLRRGSPDQMGGKSVAFLPERHSLTLVPRRRERPSIRHSLACFRSVRVRETRVDCSGSRWAALSGLGPALESGCHGGCYWAIERQHTSGPIPALESGACVAEPCPQETDRRGGGQGLSPPVRSSRQGSRGKGPRANSSWDGRRLILCACLPLILQVQNNRKLRVRNRSRFTADGVLTEPHSERPRRPCGAKSRQVLRNRGPAGGGVPENAVGAGGRRSGVLG